MNLHQLLIDELSYVDPEWGPRVKHIKPWAEFKPVIKSQQLDLGSVPMEKLWFWSDQHFNHKNIIKYCNRPFVDCQDMEDKLIANYLDTIKNEDDVVIWVGDVTFMGDTFMNDILRNLPGYKILIMGNHDFDHRVPRRLDFDEMHSIISLQNFIISHHPWNNVPSGYYHIHGHTHVHKTNNPLHINVCVENTDYRPRNFVDILNEVLNKESE